MRAQGAPVPFNRQGIRRGNSLGGAVAALGRLVSGSQDAALTGHAPYYGATQDHQIRRDRTSWFPVDRGRSGVGNAEPDWSLAGPPRPELHTRNVTVRTMAGTSQTRAFTDPRDPTVGLHSSPKARPSGNLERYKAGAASMKHGRTDRLSPARYSGQSYSQTTLEQGARR